MLSFVWRAEALEDLRAITAYVSARDVRAARRLQELVDACADRVARHPLMYRVGRVPGTREAVVHSNYILVYRVTAERIEFVNVVHARQRYP